MYKNISILIVCLVCTHTLTAQKWQIQKQEIPEVQYATENQFGSVMASDSSGNFVVVGAPEEDAGELNSGAAYIYQRINNNYKLIKKLKPSDPSEGKNFGRAVAIDDNIIVIGAPYDKSSVYGGGAAYIFIKGKSGWEDALQMKRIAPDDLSEYSYFGRSVDVKKDVIIIGSSGKKAPVYVFEMNENVVSLTAKLSPSKYESETRIPSLLDKYGRNCLEGCNIEFGKSIAVGDDFIAIGAPEFDIYSYNDNQGAIFVYDKPYDGWKDTTESTILYLSEVLSQAELGYGLVTFGNLIYASARAQFDQEGHSYLFEKKGSGWQKNPIAHLKVNEFVGGSYNVSLNENYAVIGAPQKYSSSIGVYGGVFVFNKPKEGWKDANYDFVINHNDSLRNLLFGFSVLATGDTLLIGAPSDNRPSLAAGSVFQIAKSGDEWRDNDLTRWETPREKDASNYIFGDDVSIYKNTMVVGAPKDNTYGAAYVYEKQYEKWKKVAKLTAKEGKDKDGFGFSVKVHKDIIIVGAPYVDDSIRSSVGAAYVYQKPISGWKDMHETAKFTASDTSYRLGYSVDITNSFAVVGAPETLSPYRVGGVYVFNKTNQGWVSKTEDSRLDKYFTKEADMLGHTLECNENEVLVSLPTENKAYLFEKNGQQWDIEHPIVFELPRIDNVAIGIVKAFHLSIGLSEDAAVIGWPYDIRKDTWGAGTVYTYHKVNGEWQKNPNRLESPMLKPNGFFGADVAIDNNFLIVGANGGFTHNTNQRQAGTAYVYNWSNDEWHLIDSLSATCPTPGDRFSTSVGVSGTNFLIGAPHDTNEVGYRSGSTYTFRQNVPWIKKVSSTQKDGCYGIGQEIIIDVHYDREVCISGTPKLTVALDTMTYQAFYKSGSGTSKLSFSYTVQEGHHSSDLTYTDVSALKGTIFSRDSVKASTQLPTPGSQASLSGNKDIKIDGKRPLVKDSILLIDSLNQYVAIHWITDEMIHQLDSNFIEVFNAQLLSIERIDALNFVTHLQPQQGQVILKLKEGVVKDKAYNAALEVEKSFCYKDLLPPVVSISADTAVVSDPSLKMTFTMSEPVKNFYTENIKLQNAVIKHLYTEDSITFIAELFITNEGEIEVRIPENSVYDHAGNSNQISESLLLFHDAFPPIITPGQHFNIEENTTRGTMIGKLMAEDTAGKLQDWKISLADGSSTFSLDSITGELTLIGELDFEKEAEYILLVTVSDGFHLSEPVVVIVNVLDIDEIKPTVIITSQEADTVSGKFDANIIFSEAVQGFTLSDITVQNATLTQLHTSDSITFSARIDPLDIGPIHINIPYGVVADVAGNSNQSAAQLTLYYRKKSEALTLDITDEATTMITIGPNPVQDQLYIYSPGTFQISKILLIDQHGRTVITSSGANSIDTTKLMSGVYTLIIQGKEFTITRKLICTKG